MLRVLESDTGCRKGDFLKKGKLVEIAEIKRKLIKESEVNVFVRDDDEVDQQLKQRAAGRTRLRWW